MTMTKRERGTILDTFELEALRPLREKIRATVIAAAPAKIEELQDMRRLERELVTQVRMFKDVDHPTPENVLFFFTDCVWLAENHIQKTYLEDILASRSWARTILDTVKHIANLCIKILTIGYVPQFFDTTAIVTARSRNQAPGQLAVNTIKDSMARFAEAAEAADAPQQQAAAAQASV